MTRLDWDGYPSVWAAGLDRGVLYFADGESVVWNGLIGVKENTTPSAGRPLYFDGICYNLEQELVDYSADIEAYVYPYMLEDHILALCDARTLIGEVPVTKPFGFTYRTKTSNGYKLHLVYNVTATIDTMVYNTLFDGVNPTTFNFKFNTIPEKVDTARPTSYFVIHSPEAGISRMYEIEKILYGSENSRPYFPPVEDLVALFNA